jgi:hypothetical protein
MEQSSHRVVEAVAVLEAAHESLAADGSAA